MANFSIWWSFQTSKMTHICYKRTLFLSQLLSTNYVSSLFVILHWPMANEHTESTQNLTFWRQKMTPDFGAIIIELREKW